MKLRGGCETRDPRLDRLPQFDERSRGFPIAAAVPKTLRGRTWPCSAYLDQGSEGACVGFAWAHELVAWPRVFRQDAASARWWYHEAQKIDEWEGGSYPGASPAYEGTSVLAGAKVVQSQGHMAEYRWAFSIDEVLRAISHEGPVVFGIPWRDSMFDTRPDGLLDCSGDLEAGGHAILGRGLLLKPRLAGVAEPVVRLRNSWGRGWGVDGDAFIRVSDLEDLLRGWGECCVPLDRRLL